VRIRTSVAAVTVAMLATGGGLLAMPAFASSATHTLTFTAKARAENTFSGSHSGAQFEKDYTAGKLIGYDIVTFQTQSSGFVALAVNGGFIYGHLHFSNGPTTTGRVTGGAGAFKGVKGTIVGKSINNKTTNVTVTYHR
jgi:hypothetical protein